MNIAIVGSGITGLAAAWLLSQAGHRVSLFEKHGHLGMDAHSVCLPEHFRCDAPQHLNPNRIDVPPRLFNQQLWPNVVQLYEQAGIETCKIDPTKTFCDEDGVTYLARLIGYRPSLTDLLRKDVRQIATDAADLLDQARSWKDTSSWPAQNLKQFWQTHRYSGAFIFRFLYPALSSTVCTCDYLTLDEYPVEIIFSSLLQMIDGDPLSRTRWGSQDVATRLSAGCEIHLNSTVSHAKLNSNAAHVLLAINNQDQEFDHLIIATQANHVSSIVEDLPQDEQKVLESFRYVAAPVVVHTDESLMPSHPRHWSHFNMQTPAFNLQTSSSTSHDRTVQDEKNRPATAQCTMWINRFRDDGQHQSNLFQTIMPFRQPRPSSILATGNLQRPAVCLGSLERWNQLETAMNQPNRRIWYCGSYAVKGIPLLESGVKSAKQVVDRILNSSTC